MRILHLSADYPDPLVPAKTRAVSNLLALTAGDHDHRVLSLNRVGWSSRSGLAGLGAVRALAFEDSAQPEEGTAGHAHRALAYAAPPKGVFLRRCLERVADWAELELADWAGQGWHPDLIHAHKLSIEGIVGARLAALLGCPLAVSIQGDSDLKILKARRDLHGRWRQIWQEAGVVFPFAPWAETRIAAMLGQRAGPVHLLPCPGVAETRRIPEVTPPGTDPVIRTALHLGVAGRKNAAGLIRAVGRASAVVPNLRLEVLGGGDAEAFSRLAALAESAAPGRVRFLGNVPNAQVQDLFQTAAAFALPSRRETYGMVFAEALLAGTPCLIPRGWGIDGYFKDESVVLAVDASSEEAIAEGLVRLVRGEAEFKVRLAALGEAGGLAVLQSPAIRQTYLNGLAQAVARAQDPPGPDSMPG